MLQQPHGAAIPGPLGLNVGTDAEPPQQPTGKPVLSAVVGTNRELIAEASRLWIAPGDVVLDATYGRGAFWPRGGPLPHLRHDIRLDGVDLRALPEPDATVDVVVLDPPYRPSFGGSPGPQHDGYGLSTVDSMTDVLDLYRGGIREAFRVLRPGGRVMVKCADMSYSRRLHMVHLDVLQMLAKQEFLVADFYVLMNRTRMPSRAERQLRARRAHSYLLVAVKV